MGTHNKEMNYFQALGSHCDKHSGATEERTFGFRAGWVARSKLEGDIEALIEKNNKALKAFKEVVSINQKNLAHIEKFHSREKVIEYLNCCNEIANQIILAFESIEIAEK